MTDNQARPVQDARLRDEASRQAQANVSPRILVVDDEKEIRHFNTSALRRSGYEVDAVEDGAAAWDILQRNCYRLLITDFQMPKVNGVELLKKVRAARMALPVIIATATPLAVESAINPGLVPNAVLLKPYTFQKFMGTVETVLRATADLRENPEPGK